jgi:hypothetical protein
MDCSLSAPPYAETIFATGALAKTLAYEDVPATDIASELLRLRAIFAFEVRTFSQT